MLASAWLWWGPRADGIPVPGVSVEETTSWDRMQTRFQGQQLTLTQTNLQLRWPALVPSKDSAPSVTWWPCADAHVLRSHHHTIPHHIRDQPGAQATYKPWCGNCWQKQENIEAPRASSGQGLPQMAGPTGVTHKWKLNNNDETQCQSAFCYDQESNSERVYLGLANEILNWNSIFKLKAIFCSYIL